jgi:hypothetical protein
MYEFRTRVKVVEVEPLDYGVKVRFESAGTVNDEIVMETLSVEADEVAARALYVGADLELVLSDRD